MVKTDLNFASLCSGCGKQRSESNGILICPHCDAPKYPNFTVSYLEKRYWEKPYGRDD